MFRCRSSTADCSTAVIQPPRRCRPIDADADIVRPNPLFIISQRSRAGLTTLTDVDRTGCGCCSIDAGRADADLTVACVLICCHSTEVNTAIQTVISVDVHRST